MVTQSDSNTVIQLETIQKVWLEDGSNEWRALSQDERDENEYLEQKFLDLSLDYYDSSWTD